MNAKLKSMSITELNQRYSSAAVAAALVDKICLHDQQVVARPRLTRAEQRRSKQVRALALQIARSRAEQGRAI